MSSHDTLRSHDTLQDHETLRDHMRQGREYESTCYALPAAKIFILRYQETVVLFRQAPNQDKKCILKNTCSKTNPIDVIDVSLHWRKKIDNMYKIEGKEEKD